MCCTPFAVAQYTRVYYVHVWDCAGVTKTVNHLRMYAVACAARGVRAIAKVQHVIICKMNFSSLYNKEKKLIQKKTAWQLVLGKKPLEQGNSNMFHCFYNVGGLVKLNRSSRGVLDLEKGRLFYDFWTVQNFDVHLTLHRAPYQTIMFRNFFVRSMCLIETYSYICRAFVQFYLYFVRTHHTALIAAVAPRHHHCHFRSDSGRVKIHSSIL